MKKIDIHTHGINGRDSRSTDPEEYLRLAESYKQHGTDGFLVTLFPDEVDKMRDILAAVKAAMGMKSDGAEILGAYLEGPFVNPAKCGALDPEKFAECRNDTLTRLVEGFEDVVRVIAVAPELPAATGLIEKSVSMGIRVSMGHSTASFEEAADGAAAGATGVTHLYNAMSGLHHRSPGLAAYALTDDRLYVELIADGVHVHPEMLLFAIKNKPKERVILVSDSLGPAKEADPASNSPLYMPDGTTLAGSGISLTDAYNYVVSLGISSRDVALFTSANPLTYLCIQP